MDLLLHSLSMAPGSVVAESGYQEAYECYIKIYFGGGKGAASENPAGVAGAEETGKHQSRRPGQGEMGLGMLG